MPRILLLNIYIYIYVGFLIKKREKRKKKKRTNIIDLKNYQMIEGRNSELLVMNKIMNIPQDL